VTAPPPPAGPPAPVTIVVDEGSRSLSSRFITWHGFLTTRPGELRVTVDWTSPGNNLDVFLARGACDPDQLDAGVCIVMGTAESPTAKPETIVVPDAVQGLFTLFVVNLGATTETFSYRATVTYTPAATTEPGLMR